MRNRGRTDVPSPPDPTGQPVAPQQRWWSSGTRHGESSTKPMRQGLRDLTRAFSPRQLPTDHDYAVPTREYQSDQPSSTAVSTSTDAAVAGPRDERRQKERADE